MVCSKHDLFFAIYSRTFLSIIGGVVAGIWGFTGLMGFVFYFVIMMVESIGLLAKSKFSVQTYFDNWSRISIEGVFGGLMVRPSFAALLLPMFCGLSLAINNHITNMVLYLLFIH
jgi:hypothetical protein